MSTCSIDADIVDGLRWRCIGPPRGGRVVAVAGHPSEPMTSYFGAVTGGVWKTTDGGQYWENISDGYFNTAAVGALAVSQSDPNVMYAGTGETSVRIDVSYGDGIYKTTNGGKTWTHSGLKDTLHIGAIRIHPENPDLVYAAALGHAFGANEERGVYRSVDGGDTWEKVLFKSDRAGAIDLAMDQANPRILYASIWQVHRSFWEMSSGGPDSGFYRSADGGDTWEEITGNKGLPDGIKGKIGLAASPAKPGRVWALVEAEKAGLYRSDDGGDTWDLVTDNEDLRNRPWYYMHVFADPLDAETVYVLNLSMWRSTDGGKAFTEITTPHGDNHALWIDPDNTKHLVQGNDGGACISFNGGESWSTIYNQKTSQFYRIATDNRFPYHVYATQQDNSSIAVPSATEKGAVTWQDCFAPGSGESGDITVHPDDPDIVYIGAIGSSPGGGGVLQRYDHATRQIRLISVWPESNMGEATKEAKYRFAWTFPIVISPHDSNVLYAAGNVIFKTTDEGTSWQAISPDLSRQDTSKLGTSGGPITIDASGAEQFATVYTFSESPHTPGELWAGTDDGLAHISRDGGRTWTDITPTDLPEWSMIWTIELSHHSPGKAYLSATRYKLDDYNPYVYKTEDFGKSWCLLTDSYPEGQISRVLREDPSRPGLLYVGTETGIMISPDDGISWQRFASNLPVVPVYDMTIKDDDLVIATHGRGFWILDDLTPLREVPGVWPQAHLCKPRPTYRRWINWTGDWFEGEGKHYMVSLGANVTFREETTPEGEKIRHILDGGENPPQGVIIYYYLKVCDGVNAQTDISLTILDTDGREIRTYVPRPERDENVKNHVRYMTVKAGLNRFVWDMRHPGAVSVADDKDANMTKTGPIATTGTYMARLKVGDQNLEQSFEIVKDPRVSAEQVDFDAQTDLLIKIRDRLSEVNGAVNHIRNVKKQVNDWLERIEATKGPDAQGLKEAGDTLKQKLTDIERELIQTEGKAGLMLPVRLSEKLTELISDAGSADFTPPKQVHDVFEHLSGRVGILLTDLDTVVSQDVSAFNEMIMEEGVGAVQ